MHIHIYTHTYTYTPTYTHTYNIHIITHTYTHTHTRAHTRIHIHIRVNLHTHAHTHIHMHMHRHIHLHIHIHIHILQSMATCASYKSCFSECNHLHGCLNGFVCKRSLLHNMLSLLLMYIAMFCWIWQNGKESCKSVLKKQINKMAITNYIICVA